MLLQDCIFSQYTGGSPPHPGYMDSKDNKYIGRHSLGWFLPLSVLLLALLSLAPYSGTGCCWWPPTFCCSCFQIGFAPSCRQTWTAVAGSEEQMHGPVLEGRQLCAPWNFFCFDSEFCFTISLNMKQWAMGLWSNSQSLVDAAHFNG